MNLEEYFYRSIMSKNVGVMQMSADQLRMISELSGKGFERPKIAEEVGVSESSVYRKQKELLHL